MVSLNVGLSLLLEHIDVNKGEGDSKVRTITILPNITVAFKTNIYNVHECV